MNINSTSSGSSSTDYSRITGLATGMDIDGMVKSALAADQTKIDKENQNLQYVQWQQEAYVDVIKDLKDFYNSFDVLKSDNMMLSSTYAGVKASVATGGENIATATASPGAVKGNYQVTVTNLASTAKEQSKQLNEGTTGTTKLSDLGLDLTSGESIKITVNNKVFTVTVDASKTISEFVNTLRSTKLDTGEVLGSYINVNFSELTRKLTIETKDTGSTQQLTVEDVGTGTIKSKLQMLHTNGENATGTIKAPGEANQASFDKSTNNFSIDNMNYSLVAEDTIAITVKADASDQVDKFKKFIEKYNTLVEKLNTKINEKKQYTYKPLTDAQKEEMKDDEITKWETEAKQGILRRESNIVNMLSAIRTALFTPVDGTGISLSDVGISTTSNYMNGGKLQLDETKLKSALEQKGDLVENLFVQSGTTDSTKGIFQRIKTSVDNMVGLNGILVKKAGYTDSRWASSNDLSKNIQDKNTRIKEMQSRMADKQQRLYSMYAVLEKNMNNLNSQSSWLYSQLGTS